MPIPMIMAYDQVNEQWACSAPVVLPAAVRHLNDEIDGVTPETSLLVTPESSGPPGVAIDAVVVSESLDSPGSVADGGEAAPGDGDRALETAPERTARYMLADLPGIWQVNPRTVERWLAKASVTPHRDPQNGRKRYITAEEYQQLEHRFIEAATPSPDMNERGMRVDRSGQLQQIQALRQEVETISREVSNLRATVADLTAQVGAGLREVAKTLTQIHLEREERDQEQQ